MRLSAAAFIASALTRFSGNATESIYGGLATNYTSKTPSIASKGKRSRRRRAARMKAKGFVNHDGMGWISPEEYNTVYNPYD